MNKETFLTEVMNFSVNDVLRNLHQQRIERCRQTLGGGSSMFYESQNVIHTNLYNNDLINEMIRYTNNETL